MSILDFAIERRSIENPNEPLTFPDDWLQQGLGGGGSASGVRVTSRTAMTYPPFWRGVNLLSTDVAKLPLKVRGKTNDGGTEVLRQHPVFKLLRRQPNQWMSAFIFWQTIMHHRLTRGNAYAVIIRNGGVPRSLGLLDPGRTFPIREHKDGRVTLHYSVEGIGGRLTTLPPEDVLHFRGLGDDGLTGFSVIQFGEDALGLGLAGQTHASQFFRGGAMPGVVLEMPGIVTPETAKDVVDKWNSKHEGVSRAFKTALLQRGMQAKTLSVNAKDSQLSQSRKMSVVDAANILGMPSYLLGDDTRTSFSSLEVERRQYHDGSVDGHLVVIETECNMKLFTEEEQDLGSAFCEYERAAMLRADSKTVSEIMIKEVNGGLRLLREGRDVLGLPRVDDDEVMRRPANILIGIEPEPDNEPDDDPDGNGDDDQRSVFLAPDTRDRDEKVRAALVDAISAGVKRIVRRIGIQAKKKHGDALKRWVASGMISGNIDVAENMLAPAVKALAAYDGCDCEELSERVIRMTFDCLDRRLRGQLEPYKDRPEFVIADLVAEDLAKPIGDDNET